MEVEVTHWLHDYQLMCGVMCRVKEIHITVDWSDMEVLLNNPKILKWVRNKLPNPENHRPILTDEQRDLCKALLGPHGKTIYKAIKARRAEV